MQFNIISQIGCSFTEIHCQFRNPNTGVLKSVAPLSHSEIYCSLFTRDEIQCFFVPKSIAPRLTFTKSIPLFAQIYCQFYTKSYNWKVKSIASFPKSPPEHRNLLNNGVVWWNQPLLTGARFLDSQKGRSWNVSKECTFDGRSEWHHGREFRQFTERRAQCPCTRDL